MRQGDDDPFERWRESASDAPSVEAVSEVIGAIYDCALDPDRWETALVAITTMLRCRNATLSSLDLTQERGAFAKAVGMEPYWLEKFAEYVPEMAAWQKLPEAWNWPLDEPQVNSRDLPPEVRARSRLISEWAAPQGLVDAMALLLMHTPTRHASLNLGRHEEFGFVTEREIRLGRMLSPHVRRAAVISDVIDLRTIESTAANGTLDMLRIGVVMTDNAGRIVHANGAAETMMRDGKPIRSAAGTIQSSLPDATSELLSAIALSDGSEAALGKTGLAVRLTRAGEPPVLAHVLPLKHGEARSRLLPAASAAIFVGSVTPAANGAEAMAVAYDLTPMETRVLGELLAGRRLVEAARAIGIAESTARSHLRGLLAKTGATRQADLVRLAGQMASALLRANSAEG
jgi:DNA-binding CsgD family transcriptional regulator